MSETGPTSEIAKRIASDIFSAFHWQLYGQNDSDFDCVSEHHKNEAGKQKKTHPGDVVFHYMDPYLSKRVCLHTDLKSYKKTTIQVQKIRSALQSLAMTVECAHVSPSWREKFLPKDTDTYEVRGLLFVANHDNKAPAAFGELLKKVSLANIAVAKHQTLHVLSPENISDLYSVAVDIKLAIQEKRLSSWYRFFYPDLTLWKRGVPDDERTAATIETLLSPYFILKHTAVYDEQAEPQKLQRAGSLIYYSRNGDTVEEFVYLLDSLLRYQLVNSQDQIRIRVFNRDRSDNLKNNFDKAKDRYCRDWGFHGDREAEIQAISIEAINQISQNYNPGEIGWKDD